MDIARRLEILRRWQRRLDEAFPVPWTRIRFGWDAIIGLVPGAGDLVTALFGLVILFHAHQMRIPGVVQVRMIVNLAIDLMIGIVPVVGDVVDVFWKANTRNLALVERHVAAERPPTTGDWMFLISVAGALVFMAALPVLVLFVVLRWLQGS